MKALHGLWLASALAASTLLSQDSTGYREATSFSLTGIWRSAASGNIQGVKAAISDGLNINEQETHRGYTPLHAAIAAYEEEIVPALLELGADVNLADAEGYTALSLAVQARNKSLVQLLVKAGAELNPRDPGTSAPFAQALRWGDVEVLELFVKAGVSANSTIRVNGVEIPALAYAAYVGSAETVERLVKAGAKLESRFGPGQVTPLMYAVTAQRVSTLQRLIQLGADVNAVSARGNTALTLAALNGNERGFELILNAKGSLNGSVDEAISKVWRWGDLRLIEAVKAMGLPMPTEDPILPLAEAAVAGDLARFRDLNEKFYGNFEFGRSLMSAAASGGNLEILKIVLAGGDGGFVRYQDCMGRSLLHHAALANRPEMLDFLLQSQPNLGLRDQFGQTPLISAVRAGHLSMVEALLKAGSPVDVTDIDGLHPIELALQLGHKDIAARLQTAVPSYQPRPTEPVHNPKATPTPGAAVTLPPVTLAILPIGVVDDGWYPTLNTLANLETLMQVRLQALPGVTCVERSELNRIKEELTKQSAGMLTSSQGLAIGSLTSAEILLTSKLRSDRGNGRILNLHVLDVKTGDILSSRSIHLKQLTTGGLQLTEAIQAEVESASADLIQQARALHQRHQLARAVTLAPLFLADVTPKHTRLSTHAARFLEEIHLQGQDLGEAVRVLRFKGAGEAAEEVDMAISGLSKSDPNAWAKVSDYYLWGWCEEQGSPDKPFPEIEVKVTLNLVNARGQVTPFVFDSTVQDLVKNFGAKATEILAAIQTLPKVQPDAALGSKVAQSLADYAFDFSVRLGSNGSPTHQASILQALEAARFFDPTSPKIAALRLMQQWAGKIGNQGMPVWQIWSYHDDWAEHLAKYGTSGLEQIPLQYRSLMFDSAGSGSGSTTPKWYLTAWNGVCLHLTQKLSFNADLVPDGTPPSVLRRWREQIANEVAEAETKLMIANVTHASSMAPEQLLRLTKPEILSDYIPTHWKWMLSLKQSSLRFLGWSQDLYQRTFQDLQLPVQSALDLNIPVGYFRGGDVTFWEPETTWRPIEPRKPLAKPDSIRLTAPNEPSRMPEAWTNASCRASLSLGPVSVLSLQNLQNASNGLNSDTVLWRPDTAKTTSVVGLPADVHPSFLVAEPEKIWLGGPDFRLGYVDLKSKRFLPLPDSEGVPFDRVWNATVMGKELFVVGGQGSDFKTIARRSESGEWSVVQGPWTQEPKGFLSVNDIVAEPSSLYVLYSWGPRDRPPFRHEIVVMDATSGKWSSQTQRLELDGSFSPSAWPDADGLWILQEQAVEYLPKDPLVDATSAKIPSDVKYNGGFRPSGIHDGDWLWIGASWQKMLDAGGFESVARIILIHKPSRRYMGCYEQELQSGMLHSIQVTPEHLLLIKTSGRSEHPLITKVPKQTLIEQATEALSKPLGK